MRRLNVVGFSCINRAELRFSTITVLIGPQASGKSVLSKLTYFFIKLLRDQATTIEEGKGLEEYKEFVKEQFKEWFPPSAWGKGKFKIEFQAGDYEISLSRTSFAGRINNIKVWMSPSIEAHYKVLYDSTRRLAQKKLASEYQRDFEFSWRIRNLADTKLKRLLGKDYVRHQLFIPAGRSFFTSVGKAVAAFEHGRILDPLTLLFGRYFASLREDGMYRYHLQKKHPRVVEQTAQLLGGTVRFAREKDYIETSDGRQIPFSALSSGQQELMPLLLGLGQWIGVGSSVSRVAYIEEPEAHLFPTAQCQLVEMLAVMISSAERSLEMVLTTHSPYVLAKMNNLIKAGALAGKADEKTRKRIGALIRPNAWLKKGVVRAYAIQQGSLVDLMDKDGLINAEYLDQVSSEIAREFSGLLEIEVGDD